MTDNGIERSASLGLWLRVSSAWLAAAIPAERGGDGAHPRGAAEAGDGCVARRGEASRGGAAPRGCSRLG